ncbi:hypothetical protein HGRIS_008956 [Hohenbuehelia grisea]|uniref:DUF6570 domain-containing protein n=1 Tax=Hohenbuehelia grisea TaxID=104357 RepID=A0ABR3IZU1_9AGAR
MQAHAIAFQAPIPKLYAALPPARSDIDDILAIMFRGPCRPSAEHFKRTPFLVRRRYVVEALQWLQLNHHDYRDIEISNTNLETYPEDYPPVTVEYRETASAIIPEGTSVHDIEDERGVADGDCPFIVHGITGDQFGRMSDLALKAKALQHFNTDKAVLTVGHNAEPESIWNNPHLYLQMFPWLFPYGLGGIGSTTMQIKTHAKLLLNYHDKRFQTDPTFPFVAFSHSQVKSATTAGFLLAEKSKFKDISARLGRLDTSVMQDIINRMLADERVVPSSEVEKLCFQVINDLDHVAGRVDGSITSKKYMRNEIWSLIYHRGMPV